MVRTLLTYISLVIVPIYSRRGDEKGEVATPIVFGRIGKSLAEAGGKILALILGIDFYSSVFGEESIAQLYPRIANLKNYKEDLDITVILNVKLFSERTVQIISSFSFNIVKIGIEEVDLELRRYFLIFRSVFLEYNLKNGTIQ